MEMARVSNVVLASLNFLSLLWSIIIVVVASYILAHGHNECDFESPIEELAYGIFLFCLSLVAMIGAIRNHRVLLSIYMGALVTWIVLLICFATFFFVAAKESVAKASKNHKEFQLDKYPAWLRGYVVGGKKWDAVKNCMVQQELCKNLLLYKDSAENEALMVAKSPILFSCCQPPQYCGYVNENGTFWKVPRAGLISKDPDCVSWNNHMDKMCYDCDSCKAGNIIVSKDIWLTIGYSNLIFIILLLIGLSIGFCAFRQSQRDEYKPYSSDA